MQPVQCDRPKRGVFTADQPVKADHLLLPPSRITGMNYYSPAAQERVKDAAYDAFERVLTGMFEPLENLEAAGIGRAVAISMETADRSTRIVNEWHLSNLPVAYGLDEESARAWGMNLSHAIKYGEPDLFNEPGIFILDEDGTLFWSSTATMPFGRPSLDDVIAGIRYAHDQDYSARGAA